MVRMESATQPYYLDVLSRELANRQRKNPDYSLRSYARFLDLHPGNLSTMMKGKRAFPSKKIDHVCDRLGLEPDQKSLFSQSVYSAKASLKMLFETHPVEPRLMSDQRNYEIVAQWEHYAIFELIETDGFRSEANWIASRLGITKKRVEVALARLKEAGLISQNKKGGLKRLHPSLEINSKVPSSALRKSHKENLEIGIDKLESTSTEDRHYCSETIAVNPDKIDAARKLIDEFRKKLGCLLEKGKTREVYHLCVQLYPVTIIVKETKGKIK